MDQPDADSFRTFFLAWSALLGAVVGSFLNVVVARVPAGQSVVRPRSRCPRCLAPIAWYDNLPVLSWLLLRARCRSCQAPISARYPLVEALLAGLAAWVALRHGPSAEALLELALVALLVALAFIDLDTWLLPWALTIPLALLALGGGALGLTPAGGLAPAAVGGALGFGLFLLVHVVGEKVLHKEALGFGDVVLLGAIGAWLGPRALLPVILLSSLQGAVVGVALLLAGKGEPGPQPPATAEPLAEPATAALISTSASTSTPTPTPAPASTPASASTESPTESPTPASTSADPAAPNPASIEPPLPAEVEEAWIPPRHAIPYGPFLALAALEWLFLGPALGRLVPALSVFLR